MKKKEFEKLIDSIREAGRIRREDVKACRVTEFALLDVNAIRRWLGKSQKRPKDPL
jgi:hypothetical protein